MVQRTFLGCMLALFCLTLTGCGADTHESVTKEGLAMMNNILTDMEAGMPKDKIEAKYKDQAKALKARMDKLPKQTAEEKKKLEEKLQPEMMKMLPKIMSASAKAGPGGMPDFDILK